MGAGGRFNYGEYAAWPDGERWELIDGTAYASAPSSPLHQRVLGRLYAHFHEYFRGKRCEALIAPVEVLFPPEGGGSDEAADTVVKPDLLVLCDEAQLADGYVRGAPTLIAEVLSPATLRRDLRWKFERYERAGVREYWIVDPANELTVVHVLKKEGLFDPGRYAGKDAAWSDWAASAVFPGLELPAAALFAPSGLGEEARSKGARPAPAA